jgi:tetratricopeptide (TPR) repeat protein
MDAFARQAPDPAESTLHLYMEANFSLARGDYHEFFRIEHLQRYFDDDPDNPRWSQDTSAAEAFAELGDMKAAKTRAGEALAAMKAQLALQPDNSVLWASVSLAQSLLGNREETMRAAQKTSELMPESRDAIVGPENSDTLALAFAWIGEKDRALAEIDRLLHVPWGLNIYMSRVSFRPLRDDPRFKALVESPRNNDPLF